MVHPTLLEFKTNAFRRRAVSHSRINFVVQLVPNGPYQRQRTLDNNINKAIKNRDAEQVVLLATFSCINRNFSHVDVKGPNGHVKIVMLISQKLSQFGARAFQGSRRPAAFACGNAKVQFAALCGSKLACTHCTIPASRA